MLKYKLDLQMIFLVLLTLTIWYVTDYIHFFYGFGVYLLIFIYLIIKRKPISHFFVVALFSVMSLRGNTKDFEIEYVLLTILFFYVLIHNIKNKTIVIGNLLLPLLLFLIYSAISILWTPVKQDGFIGLLGILEGYMVYYILINGFFKIKKEHLINISKIATYIMITLSIELIYIYFKFGFEKVLFRKRLVNLDWGYSNFIVVIFVILIPIALYKYLDKKNYYFLYFILDIINLFCLFLTQSRGAYVGILFALLIFSIFYVRKQFILRYGSIIIVPSILFITVFNKYFLKFYHLIKDRFFTDKIFDDTNRFPLYDLALKAFKDKIVFGNGLKSSKYFISHFLEGRDNSHYHNFILQIAATLGIVGLILFSFIVIRWIKVLFKPKDKFVVCGAISIIGALTHQLVDVSFDLFYFGVFFYGVIATVEIYRNNIKDDKVQLKYLGKLERDKR